MVWSFLHTVQQLLNLEGTDNDTRPRSLLLPSILLQLWYCFANDTEWIIYILFKQSIHPLPSTYPRLVCGGNRFRRETQTSLSSTRLSSSSWGTLRHFRAIRDIQSLQGVLGHYNPPPLVNKIPRYLVPSTFDPEKAFHLFLIENHGLGFGIADSNPRRLTLSCEPLQCSWRSWLEEANRTPTNQAEMRPWGSQTRRPSLHDYTSRACPWKSQTGSGTRGSPGGVQQAL